MEDTMQRFKKGEVVLIFDSDSREKETDLVIAAEFMTPQVMEQFRKDAGGLICCAVQSELAQKIGLPFMRDVYQSAIKEWPLLNGLSPNKLKYDSRSAFSLTVNHKNCFTGVSDEDRALTIKDMVNVQTAEDFQSNYDSPGHVPLLIGAPQLTKDRQGHTELSLALAEMVGAKPVTVVCEMLDSGTSLSRDKAMQHAEQNGLAFIDGADIIEAYSKF